MPASDDAFLNITRSAKGQRWESRLKDQRLAQAIAEKHDLPEILGRVMAARGVAVEDVEAYLNPTIRGLMPKPSDLMDMEKGALRLAEAIIAKEKIGIISDYDVDGVTSAALLLRFLRAVGHDAITYLPDRLTEGYGPSEKAVASLKEQGTEMLLTLDCGVLSHDPLAHAADLGLTTIIIDHHQAGVELPHAWAVINPNRQDDMSGQGHLCACGIVFLVIATTNKILREKRFYAEGQEPNLLQWLDLVALATIADVVPLKGLNRAYVTQGLKVMARRDNLGIAALCDVGGVKRRPDAYALGFILGPRINAAGRVGHADEALALLTTTDKGDAAALAHHLNEMNRHRQAVELRVVDEAVAQAELALGAERQASALVVAAENWHPGVVGLAASRLKDRYGVPSLVLALNKITMLATGSGRSIAGVDLGKAVRAALEAGHITKGGGHAMAAGMTLEIEKLAALRQFMEQYLSSAVEANRTRSLLVDGALSASGATLDLIELLEQAGPYGAANPSPLFVFPAHKITYADRAGTDHVRCTLVAGDGTRLKAIAFRALGTELGELLLSERQHPIHVAGRLVADEWGAKRVPALQIEDAALMV
ncbi:single-stranded-DNA-specific exonuclease RecJ [Aestuariivirga litoralis]|uniref:single-stranded-DNA-specific exonuclease RecJ n=1 Tax=Aestuariivirga litoralis TaxID=2650924 RepID=UPI0018C6DC6D|nr:single-stranded-DNA-specific exonuclease RecJ [Aestuariivirga litoralis]MBG1231771.1 single-stranded-DNA-specific exonuclease RecJ [Aestuariivirga litoralis]